MRQAALAILGAVVVGFVGGTVVVPVITASRPIWGRQVEPARPAERPIWRSGNGAYAAELLRVLDGDTFEARVYLWPGLHVTTKVRLRGIDAPELKARCRAERDLAEAARDALTAILAEGKLMVRGIELDKYAGRVVADAATAHTTDVSHALLTQGVARVYSGGRRQGWCGS
jgi:endonuclease YncB( thermonuclease family)